MQDLLAAFMDAACRVAVDTLTGRDVAQHWRWCDDGQTQTTQSVRILSCPT